MLRLRGNRITRLPWRGLLFTFCFLLQYILLGAIGGLPAQAGSDIKLYINGKLFAPPVPPYLDTAGRTMIPIRAVMEYVGAQVEWQEREQKVIIRRDGNTLELWVGKRQARLNERTLWLDVVPVLKQGTTMVPVRAVVENLGGSVEWDGTSFSVHLWIPKLKPAEEEPGPGQGGGGLAITALEVTPLPEGLKVWVKANRAFEYNTFSLSNPTRLVVDIPGASLELPKDKWQVEVGKNGITRIRLSQYNQDTVRLVFDLEASLKLTAETAPGGQGLLFYLSKPSLKGRKIVLDPGHGTDPQGTDPGAIGPTGVKEKDVNLAIALKLAQLLRAEGVKVYLTREGESTPFSLVGRAYYANDLKADVFISIHSNASLNPSVGGTSTYFYAPPGTELGAQREERLRLARCIQESLVAALGRRNIGVLEANFAVLRNTKMPSVLVEVAFISNPEEERLLNDPAFQAKAAQGILEGLKKYFGDMAK